MGVDQPGEDQVAASVENLLGGIRELGRRPDLLDPSVPGKQPAVRDLPAIIVHRRHQRGVSNQKGAHVEEPTPTYPSDGVPRVDGSLVSGN